MTIIFSNRHEIRQLNTHLHTYMTLIRGQRNVIALNFFYNHKQKGHDSLLFWNDVVEDKIYKGVLGSTGAILVDKNDKNDKKLFW